MGGTGRPHRHMIARTTPAPVELDIHLVYGKNEYMETTALPLDRMTIGEKLMTMEVLWDDLCHNEEQIPVQDWHKQILDERQHQIDSGDARFVDWEEAKARIRARIS
jgi:hypothetical protein